jgi:hypothetical protein
LAQPEQQVLLERQAQVVLREPMVVLPAFSITLLTHHPRLVILVLEIFVGAVRRKSIQLVSTSTILMTPVKMLKFC